MSLPTYIYPLDLTGRSPNNLVANEPHTLGATGNRAFVMNNGPFFVKSLVVKNALTGQVLVPNDQYKPLQLMPDLTALSGLNVCAVIWVTDPSVTQVTVTAQVVGGDASGYNEGIMRLIESLELDNRSIYWGQIVGKPEFYPPARHLHDIGDVYGFEYLVAAIYTVRDAVLIGDAAAHREIMDYIDGVRAELRGDLDAMDNRLTQHINRVDNPHNTTKAQVGLSAVQNYGIASEAEARAGTSNTVYLTPLRAAQLVDALIGTAISDHANNTNNPHNVTKTQVGLGAVQNYGIATDAEAQAGTATNKYMTPALVKTAITALVGTSLSAHIGRTDNPHSVTKAQVGLGSVMDYPLATTAQAQAGTATNAYMTPALVKSAIDTQVMVSLNNHISRVDNPHNVTKAQVGLGSVQDFGIASTAQAQAGTATNVYMTPALVKAAIDAVLGGNLSDFTAHINSRANPHQVTKAQVGLGSVLDYGIATDAEAQAGASTTKYMTPALVRSAINAIAVTPLTAQINNRVVINSAASLGSLTIGQGYIYANGNNLNIRVNGTSFFTFDANGNLVANNGRVMGLAFRPSDERLKKNIRAVQARALWRDLDYSAWEMIADGSYQQGWIAQRVQETAPDLISTFNQVNADGSMGEERLAVDTTSAAMEMAVRAGQETDQLRQELAELKHRFQELHDLVHKHIG